MERLRQTEEKRSHMASLEYYKKQKEDLKKQEVRESLRKNLNIFGSNLRRRKNTWICR